MFWFVNNETVPLTAALVERFVSMKPLPGERPLKESHKKWLIGLIKEGKFREPHWSLLRFQGEDHRGNGQHSSWAIKEAPDGSVLPENAIIEIYETDNLAEDAPEYFAMYDHSRIIRTKRDHVGLYTSAFAEIHSFGHAYNDKVADGVAEYLHQEYERQKERAEKARAEAEKKGKKEKPVKLTPYLPYAPKERGKHFIEVRYREFAIAFHDLFTNPFIVNRDFFDKALIVSRMVERWLSNPQDALTYWGYILREDHPDRFHPSRTLAEDFKSWDRKAAKVEAEKYRMREQKAWQLFLKEQLLETPADLTDAESHLQSIATE
jgi:hypothetical protein